MYAHTGIRARTGYAIALEVKGIQALYLSTLTDTRYVTRDDDHTHLIIIDLMQLQVARAATAKTHQRRTKRDENKTSTSLEIKTAKKCQYAN